ncbi:DUF1294 domain-containing protein [Lysobacter enzymogenes]|uniref:CSD domain-containing protein n=1 Tax=Lysobacter enzymogenes TaxID=69 RepID=A0AAU9AUM3_LYSEN|nr:cold shock and DUF1294 domain-containing protein [Lysobacter enzymogenes]BAV97646.1 conserved hypothetical protein [Lysobacter enzymogenes]
MRQAGRICEWNDDKGYGFVAAHDGGARAFVHVKAFQAGSRRPAVGDLVSYRVAKDAKGRANAVELRFAGQRIERRPSSTASPSPLRRIPRRALGVSALLGVAALGALGWVPAAVPMVQGVFSFASYIAYGWDKDAAGADRRRTPEATLHLLDALGGWPGALIAQQQFRHKTVKASFQAMFWVTVLLNLAVVAAAVHMGWARALTSLLLDGHV